MKDMTSTYGKLLDAAGMPPEEKAAYMDALKAIARDIPDPWIVATQLPLWAADALANAVIARDPENSGCWRLPYQLSNDQVDWFRQRSLCDLKTPHLTAFGSHVRKALISGEAH